MRGPRTILIAAVVVTTGVSATILRAQQTRSFTARRVADAAPAPPPGDPSLAGRTARQLLRNGMDYLTNYGDHNRALVFLTEASARPDGLTDVEMRELRLGLEQARQLDRESAGSNDDATALAPPMPRGREITRPGSLVAASPSRSANDQDTIRQVAAEMDTPDEPPGLDLPALPTPPPSNVAAPLAMPTEPVIADQPPAEPEMAALPSPEPMPADEPLPPPLPAPSPDPANVPEPISLTGALPAEPTTEAAAPIFLTGALPAEPEPVPTPEPVPVPMPEPDPLSDIPSIPAEPIVVPSAAPESLPMPEPPPGLDQAPAAVPAPVPIPVATPPVAEVLETAPVAVPDPVEMPPLPSAEPVAEAPVEVPTLPLPALPESAGQRPQAPPTPSRFVRDPRQAAALDEAPAEAAEDVMLPPLPTSRPGNTSPVPAVASVAVAPAPASQVSLRPESLREVEEIARSQEDSLRRNPPAIPFGTSRPGPAADVATADQGTTSRLQLPRAPSPTEPRPIRVIPVPDEFVPLPAREWEGNRKYWAAASTCHMPLYFQDAVLERYGQGVEQAMGRHGRFFSYPLDDPRQSNQRNQLLQPLYSSGMFLAQIVALPYNMIMDPPWEAQYDLGYYRPGDKVPADTYYLPKTGIGPPLHGRNY